jgi:hypothetical protein
MAAGAAAIGDGCTLAVSVTMNSISSKAVRRAEDIRKVYPIKKIIVADFIVARALAVKPLEVLIADRLRSISGLRFYVRYVSIGPARFTGAVLSLPVGLHPPQACVWRDDVDRRFIAGWAKASC